MPELSKDQAVAQYKLLSPEDQARATAFRRQGMSPSRAIFLVKSQADQQDSYDREQPTGLEQVAATALGAAEAVHAPPTPAKLAFDVVANPMGWGLDSTEYAIRALTGTDEKAKEAQDAAPGEYGVGNLAGNGLNAVMALAGLKGGLKNDEPFSKFGKTEHQVPVTSTPASTAAKAVDTVAGLPGPVRAIAKLVPGVGRVVGAAEKMSPFMKALRAGGLLGDELAVSPRTKIDPAAVANYAADAGEAGAAAPGAAPAMATEDVAALDEPLQAVESLVPNDPGMPPSLAEQKAPTPATPNADWRFGEANLRSGRTPPEAQADIEAIAARAKGTPTPVEASAATKQARKAAALDQLEAKAPPSTPAELAADKAKLDPELANDVAAGDLPLKAAAKMSRGAAAKSTAPSGVKAVKEELKGLFQREPQLMKTMSKDAAKLAKRLGVPKSRVNEVQMAINEIAFGR